MGKKYDTIQITMYELDNIEDLDTLDYEYIHGMGRRGPGRPCDVEDWLDCHRCRYWDEELGCEDCNGAD